MLQNVKSGMWKETRNIQQKLLGITTDVIHTVPCNDGIVNTSLERYEVEGMEEAEGASDP